MLTGLGCTCSIGLWLCLLVIHKIPVYSLKAPVTCFKCDHVIHAAACNTTTKCNAGEVCVVRKFHGPVGEYHSSGCFDGKKCTANGNFHSSGAQLVGKRHLKPDAGNGTQNRRQSDILLCEKCCVKDKCNVLDCTNLGTISTTTAPPICVDKVSQCSDHVYRDVICQNDQNAITFCQKSCGKCPVDGGFSSWMPWSDCSVSCGASGQSFRVRQCDNPKPMLNGRPCQGQTIEMRPCNNGNCPVDGHWSTWGQWLPCNVTCGGGTSMRIRSCSNPVPRNGGKPCDNPASFLETKHCNNQSCQVQHGVDGHWSNWGRWLPCNASCGGGISIRVRSCSNPVPRFGGKPCDNPASFLETKPCNNHSCTGLPASVTSAAVSLKSAVTSSGLSTASNGPLTTARSVKWSPSTGTVVTKLLHSPTPVTMSGTTISTLPLHQKTSYSITSMTGNSGSTTSSAICWDHPLCSDPHMKRTACQDLYLATVFCPKLCKMCGPTVTPPTCSDIAGQKCTDPLFQYFTCQDPDLMGLCRFTCGKCQP